MDRTSRIFPVKRSTVVVHGEQLVIRKLVVAGIVSAEKSYLECLNTMREVRITSLYYTAMDCRLTTLV